MIYAIILIYLIALMYVYDIKDNTFGRKTMYWTSYVILVCLMAFRYRIGGDTINYIINFNLFTPKLEDLNLFVVSNRQPIPAFLFSFFKTYTDDFTYVQATFAIFVNAVVFWFIKNNTKNWFTALFLFALCFFMRFNCEIMRESLAISFFLLGYRYLTSNRFAKYYIFAFLAFMCHASSIFLFVLPLMYSSIKVSWKILSVFLFIATVAVGMSIPYVSAILNLYVENYSDYESSIFGKLSIIIFQITIPLFFISKSKKWDNQNIIKGVYVYVGCGIASLFLYILYRFNNYTVIFYIIMVADLLNHTLRKYAQRGEYLFRNAIYTFIFCYGFVGAYFSDISKYMGHEAKWHVCWYPYNSVFDPDINPDRENYIRLLNNKN